MKMDDVPNPAPSYAGGGGNKKVSEPNDNGSAAEDDRGIGDAMPTFKEVVEFVALVIDGAGVLAIVLGVLVATIRFAAVGRGEADGYRRFPTRSGAGDTARARVPRGG